MSRRAATLLIAAAALVLLLGLFFWVRRRESQATAPPPTPPPAATPSADTESWVATLWLPSESERLASESVTVRSGAEAERRAERWSSRCSRRGPPRHAPRSSRRPSRWGGSSSPAARRSSTCGPRTAARSPAAGSALELLRVYAIVHTLARNVPEVERVVLLWNGVQRPAFPATSTPGARWCRSPRSRADERPAPDRRLRLRRRRPHRRGGARERAAGRSRSSTSATPRACRTAPSRDAR